MRYVVFTSDGTIYRVGRVLDFSTALLQAQNPGERVAVVWNDSGELIHDGKMKLNPDTLEVLSLTDDPAPALMLQEIPR